MTKLISLSLAALLGFAPFAHSAPVAKIGESAPDFTLVDTNGKSHQLSQYGGKFVVLEWLNYECPYVKKHYGSGNMQSLQKKYGEKGVVWLSVISSKPGTQGHYPPATVNRMNAERKAAPAAILMDEKGQVGRMYEAKVTPHMYIINPKGTLIYAGGIDDKATADVEDIATARNHVSAALDEAMAGKKVSVTSSRAYGCGIKY